MFLRIIALGTVSFFILVFPSDKGKTKEKDSNVTFTSRAELVLIPTLVTDRSGAHVTGLTKNDFTILEDAVEQKIAAFEEIKSSEQRAFRSTNPDEFTNSPPRVDSAQNVTLVLLDFINTPFLDETNAVKELLKYLSESIDERQPMALYSLSDNGLTVVTDYSADPRVLVAALQQVKNNASRVIDAEDSSAGIGSGMARAETNKIQAEIAQKKLSFQSVQQRLAIIRTLQGIQQLAQAVAGLPGRKTLIWVSGGFPLNVSDSTRRLTPTDHPDTLTSVLPMYERTWQLLNQAQVALYPVDVTGLQVVNTPTTSTRNAPGDDLATANQRLVDTHSMLQEAASMTGGRAYKNCNDLAMGFRDAVRDSAQYYLLGYYLDQSNAKSGWRKLAVKVKREHLEVRARSGFFVTDATINPERSRNDDIALALQSPLDYTALTLAAHWDKIVSGKESGRKRISYELDVVADPALINVADNNHVVLELIASAKTNKGRGVNRLESQRFDAHLTPGRLQAMWHKGMLGYSGTLDLPPGEYTIRFVVRSDLDGRVGSLAVPLKVQ